MSCLSFQLLKRINALSIVKQRKDNFSTLHARLSDVAFINTPRPVFCPFGFPIRLPEMFRDRLYDALIGKGIFSAIHWAALPSPSGQFATEHQLSKELLTLPCDQRYRRVEMEHIAGCVRMEIENLLVEFSI